MWEVGYDFLTGRAGKHIDTEGTSVGDFQHRVADASPWGDTDEYQHSDDLTTRDGPAQPIWQPENVHQALLAAAVGLIALLALLAGGGR